MEHVHWSSRPALRSPVLVAGFTGWNDAGDAASSAVRHLAQAWGATTFAELDPEEFVDFQSTRPLVRLVDGTTREIVWPVTELLGASTPGGDVVLLVGPEPQLRWRTYCRQVVEVAQELDVGMTITLGALLADVPHKRPVSLIGTASDPALVARFGLQRSRYEGPTGIVGCLHDACSRAGVPSMSLWAAVPEYASGTPSPKATLALVRRAAELVGSPVDTAELEREAAEYETDLDDYIGRDEDLQSYVERLERLHAEEAVDDEGVEPVGPASHPSAETGSAERLVAEVEQYLRDQGTE